MVAKNARGFGVKKASGSSQENREKSVRIQEQANLGNIRPGIYFIHMYHKSVLKNNFNYVILMIDCLSHY